MTLRGLAIANRGGFPGDPQGDRGGSIQRGALRLVPVPWFRAAGLVRTTALPGAGFVPYAGAVPDGGRHGFEAAKTVASPHRLAA